MDIPQVILDYNKKAGTNRILPMSQAKSLYLKRFFSGSFGVDKMLGGGAAFRRIQLLYGSKSAGKNALLNQMMAYHQRTCRHCRGIMPQYQEAGDRWSDAMAYIIGKPFCSCGNAEPMVVLFYDYEKTLTIEDAKTTSVAKYFSKENGEEISANDFNENSIQLDELKEKSKLTAADKVSVDDLEKWFENIDVQSEAVDHMRTDDYLKLCGVKTDLLQVMAPANADEGIDSLPIMIKSKQIDLIIWDSLQASITKYVGERSVEDSTMGTEAKMNGLMMRHITSAFSADDIADETDAYKPAVFITAQVRSSLGGFFPKADTYSGGKAVEHFISSALELKRGIWLNDKGTEAKKGESYYGQEVNIRADKNKLSTPYTKCSYNYYFRNSEIAPVGFIDYFDELLSIAIDAGIISQGGGGNYAFKDVKVRGKDNLVAEAKQNPTFLKEVYSEIRNA